MKKLSTAANLTSLNHLGDKKDLDKDGLQFRNDFADFIPQCSVWSGEDF